MRSRKEQGMEGAAPPRVRPGPRGFTLAEMLVALTIASILVAAGAGSFQNVTTQNRIANQINGLLGDMQFARAEAIKEGRPVTVCASTNGTTCAPTTAWEGGWIVFKDSNGNQTVDPGESVLRVQQALTGGDTVAADNGITSVTYNRQGFAFGLPGTITLALHDPTSRASWVRCLAVSIVGQLQIQTSGTGNCQ